MEERSSLSPLAGSDSLLASVLRELKRSTKRIPPVITVMEQQSSPKKENFSTSSPSGTVSRNGITEYSAYSKVIDNKNSERSFSPEKSSPTSAWKKFKSPPIKPRRKKKADKANGVYNTETSIDSEIHSIIESAFSQHDDPSKKSYSDDSEVAVFSPDDTPVRTYSDPNKCDDFSGSYSAYQRQHHGSSFHSDIASNFKADQNFSKLHSSRSYDSLDDSRFETVSMYSQISDDDQSSDWLKGTSTEYGDTISLSSFASADGQLDGRPDKKRIDPKARAKQLKKQAAVQREKVGAFLDAAASTATNRIRKIRKPSMKFKTGRAKIQHLANRLGNKQNESNHAIYNISAPNTHVNGNFSDSEDSGKKGSPQERHLASLHGYADSNKSGRQTTLKSGYLKKQGGKIRGWNERWFVLKGDHLHYHKDENGKSSAAIFLPGSQINPCPSRPNETHKFCFEIIPDSKQLQLNNNHESYLLSASSQSDMDEWVKAIRRVILSPFGGGIFGQNLDETLRYDRRLGSNASISSVKSGSSGHSLPRQVPIIVENCVEFMRANKGLTEEGLFRLPGQANEVKDLQDAYDMGDRPVFPKTTDVHTIASLLKCYLRELPEPVIPFEQYEALLNAAKLSQCEEKAKQPEAGDASTNDEIKKIIKEQINLLPQSNFDLLRYLCQFLDEVQQHSATNKMDVSNLALVFGPNLMRAKEENALAMMADQAHVQRIVHKFIENHEYFFPNDEPPHRSKHYDSNSLERVVEESNLNGDAGIGTLTTTASPVGTLPLRHAADDSGTGSLDATPENTQKRAPPIPINPPPPRKPLKPNRRRSSAQSTVSLDTSDETQRKSVYDNVTASSSQTEPDTHSNSSLHAVAGSVDSLDSRRSNSVQSDILENRSALFNHSPKLHSDHHSRPESTPSLSRTSSGSTRPTFSANKDASTQHPRGSSSPSTKSYTVGADTARKSGRLSGRSIGDESSVSPHPALPPKPQLPGKKPFDNNQSTSSQRSSKTDLSSVSSPNSLERRLNSSPRKSPRTPSYKELEEQVHFLKEELQKQQNESEKRMKLLEEQYVLKMRRLLPSNSSVSSISALNEEVSASSFPSDESVADIWNPHSAFGRRLSAESLSDVKYQEEVKRHAMTKIRLRNAERGLEQAEERNRQLQTEMEQFFHTFGGMLNPTANDS